MHNREGGRKESMETRTWVSSKCKKGEVCDTILAFCASVGYHEHVFQWNFYMATRNADSSSHIGQPGLWFHRSKQSPFSDCQLPCTSVDCSLLLTALICSGTLPSLVFFLFHRRSCAQALYVGFVPEQTDLLTGTHPYPQKQMPNIVPQIYSLNNWRQW